MKPLLILNDVHLGVRRVAGTTPNSQLELRSNLAETFQTCIMSHLNKDLLINGDLFDGFEVDMIDVLMTYLILSNWLSACDNGSKLYLAAGNHDIGKRDDKLSSFGLLTRLLMDRYPDRVVVIDKGLTSIADDIHVIPHCMNQDLFNIELEKALHAVPGFLFLHANVDNGFAENSDHSLNVDGEWLTRLSRRHTLMFAHEHQHRTLKYDHKLILIMGNQWPTSVSDCLAHGEAQKDGRKFAHVLQENPESGELEIVMVPTWERKGSFIEMPWDDLKLVDERFIRITGNATSAQAAEVISTIAKFRSASSAYVITNGVVIEGVEGMDDFAEVSFENIKAFDVLSALLEFLDPAEQKAVKELMSD